MVEIIKKINESGLSPNQYFLLHSIKTGVKIETWNMEEDRQFLIDKGILTKDGEIIGDDLVSKELEEKAFDAAVRRFARIFPPIVLGHGVHARGKPSVLKNKLKTFIQLYNYDWERIYAATEHYVDRYRRNRYAYMQTASNFVIDGNGDSTLALECDTLEYSDERNDTI